jgi:hypothetical protein
VVSYFTILVASADSNGVCGPGSSLTLSNQMWVIIPEILLFKSGLHRYLCCLKCNKNTSKSILSKDPSWASTDYLTLTNSELLNLAPDGPEF